MNAQHVATPISACARMVLFCLAGLCTLLPSGCATQLGYDVRIEKTVLESKVIERGRALDLQIQDLGVSRIQGGHHLKCGLGELAEAQIRESICEETVRDRWYYSWSNPMACSPAGGDAYGRTGPLQVAQIPYLGLVMEPAAYVASLFYVTPWTVLFCTKKSGWLFQYSVPGDLLLRIVGLESTRKRSARSAGILPRYPPSYFRRLLQSQLLAAINPLVTGDLAMEKDWPWVATESSVTQRTTEERASVEERWFPSSTCEVTCRALPLPDLPLCGETDEDGLTLIDLAVWKSLLSPVALADKPLPVRVTATKDDLTAIREYHISQQNLWTADEIRWRGTESRMGTASSLLRLPPVQWAPEPLAVAGLTGSALAAPELEAVTEVLYSELVGSKYFQVASRRDTEAVLEEQNFQKSERCDDVTCLVEMGQLLAAKVMVGGTVSKIGSAYAMSLRLVDVETSQILHSATERMSGSIEQCLDLAESTARKLCLEYAKGKLKE